MIALLSGGKVFTDGQFVKADILIANGKIEKVGTIDGAALARAGVDMETLDCSGCFISPGIIDAHTHLCGGSGEGGGFSTQSPALLVSESIMGGSTTIVGTLGVDTSTKTMRELLARVKAFNEIGINAYCYTGGYDLPSKTLFGSVRDDIIFVEEIIGVGEIAIADRRAPEPELQTFATAIVDAYVAGMLSGKAGIAHIHAGAGKRGLQLIRDLFERHEIIPESIHVTHIERSKRLVEEAVGIAKRGCYVDFDIHDQDLAVWYKVYRDMDGPLSQLTATSDAGILPSCELWDQIRDCVLNHKINLTEILPCVTANPARALKFKSKNDLSIGKDADIFVFDEKDLRAKHVMSRGKVFMKNQRITFSDRPDCSRRGFDIYGPLESQ